MFDGDAAEIRSDRVEGLVPPNLDPAGIGVTLRSSPLQRTEKAFGVVDDLWSDLSLETQRLAGRMLGVGTRATNLPSVTVAIAPQRETHSAQKQGIRSLS